MVVQLRTQHHWSPHDQFANAEAPTATGTANDATVTISGSTLWPATISAVGTRGSLSTPGASGTGWTKSGSRISTTASSARLTSLDMTGLDLLVGHTDCIATDCLIDDVTVGSNNGNVQIKNAGSNGQLVHCTLKNSFTAIGGERIGGGFNPGSGWLVDGCLIEVGHENAINPGTSWTISNTVIRRFHRVDTGGSASHYDGVEAFGGENSCTIYNCVIFMTSDGLDVFTLDSWLPDTGAINFVGTIDDLCMYDCLVGGGSSCFNFGTGGADSLTNVRVGKDRSNVSHPVYYVRNSATNATRGDPGLTVVGWDVRIAEDNGTNSSTFNNTLTAETVGTP